MDLYQEIILDHYKNPHNRDNLSSLKGWKKVAESNVGCGDEIEVALCVDSSGEKITDVKWQGQGCAISTAGMSVLSDFIKGKTIAEIKQISKTELLELLGMDEINPGREKCLLLGLKAVHRVLEPKSI